jgi:hypothetical protein
MLSFQSSELGPPTPPPARKDCTYPLWVQGGEIHSLGGEGGGGGGPNSDDWKESMALCMLTLSAWYTDV